MPATVKVPTIFSAIDKVSSIVKGMSRNVRSFASTTSSAISRSSKWFNKLTPSISEAGSEMLAYAKSAAIAGGIIAGISFSAKAVTDYEQNVASFRTIVSDLSNKDFGVYKKEIGNVAKATKSSTIEVVQSFEKIAGLNAKFAETSQGIGSVSKAAITLSKASGDELGTSAENLVGIMNQFSFGADQANRTINVLAAGQAAGAASISQTSEAFKNFGSVASGANMSLEQSVGLIQTLGKFSIFGAEAGTKLRGVTLKLQQAGAGYASGQFKINDALAQVSKKYNKLTTQRAKDAFMLKLFGAENISVGKTLLSNIPLFQEFTKKVTGTSEAQKAAGINTDTFNQKLDQLTNKWVNIITTSDSAESSLSNAKDAIAFVTENMETILSVGTNVLLFFAGWKALIIANSLVMGAYNIVLGVSAGIQGVVAVSIGRSNLAIAALNITTKAVTAAQWLWNVALAAGLWPVLLIVAAIAGLIAIFYNWDSIVAWFSVNWGKFTNFLTETWSGIVNYFQEFSFANFFLGIFNSITNFLLAPLKMVLSLASQIPGAIGKGASSALGTIEKMTGNLEVQHNTRPALGTPQQKAEELRSQNPQENRLSIDINDPNKRVGNTKMSGPLKIPVSTTPTWGVK